MLSLFLACLQYCSTGVYEVEGAGVHSAALHVLVELPEVRERCVSFESVTETSPLHVFHFTCRSLKHFCLSSMCAFIVRSGCGFFFFGHNFTSVMRGLRHASMVQVLGTPVSDQLCCLCHLLRIRVCGACG